MLSSWCGGDACDQLEKKSDKQTMDLILGNLRMMLGNDVPAPSKYIITCWRSDEFSGGAYSYDTVGIDVARNRKALSEPMGNMFFAREATDTDDWHGTTVGAYATGVKAASSVGDSGILEISVPDFQPKCTGMRGNCGEQFDETCFSGLSCVLDDSLASVPISDLVNKKFATISTAMRKICSPAQGKKKLGSYPLRYAIANQITTNHASQNQNVLYDKIKANIVYNDYFY